MTPPDETEPDGPADGDEPPQDSGGPRQRDTRKQPRHDPTRPTCEICGSAMYERHCRIICPACGYQRDCSDP